MVLNNGKANIPTSARVGSTAKSYHPYYRLTGYRMPTIILAGDDEQKMLLDTPELVNNIEVHQGSESLLVFSSATTRDVIFNPSDCTCRECLDITAIKRRFTLTMKLDFHG